MNNFTVIDFETANEKRSSICQAAMIVVENGQISQTKTWFIKPQDFYFSPINTFIHKITADDCKDAPEFPDVWQEMAEHVIGKLVVAHNVGFDIYALRDVLKLYNIIVPEFHFACTMKECKERYFLLSKYTLPNICTHLNIELGNHHDAYFDAIACAQVAIKLGRFDFMRLFPHELSNRASDEVKPRWLADTTGIEIFDLSAVVNEDTLKGKPVVVTGVFDRISRKQAENYVTQIGAKLATSINKATALVVMGSAAGPAKCEKIKELNKTMFIPVIDENEFLETLQALGVANIPVA